MGKADRIELSIKTWDGPGIQALSRHDRCVWLEIKMLMWKSPRRGVLLLENGAPMMSVGLGRILGIPTPTMVKILDRIAQLGISAREDETGALVDPEMVNLERIRLVRVEAGKLGGNPFLVNHMVKQAEGEMVNLEVKDYVNQTEASPLKKRRKFPPYPLQRRKKYTPRECYSPDFELFWTAYPKKSGKGEAWKAWRKLKPTQALQDIIIAAIARQRTWPQWSKDNGQFVPNPATWLNRRQWDDEPPQIQARATTQRPGFTL